MAIDLMDIEELSKFLDISQATINYYTNLGLFKIRDRKGNKRLYDRNETKKLHDLIRQLRGEGYSLRIIQQRLTKDMLA